MSTKTNGEHDKISELRELCEKSLWEFAQWVMPHYVYGDVHEELYNFFQHNKADNKLALVPRDHLKSHCMAVTVAWMITCRPQITINYVSANPRLVQAQMRTIKGILTSDRHRMLWPDMLNYVRDRDSTVKHKPTGVWTQDMFEVDHPLRKEKHVRDATVTASTVKGSNTGLHCEVTVFDDLVTDENYNSEAERQDVVDCYVNFSKITTTGAKMYAVGTRYGDNDLYADLMEEEASYYDDDGKEVKEQLWEVFNRVVEDSPFRTGDGVFCWPRTKCPESGESFGFDRRELAIKRAKLLKNGATGFFAQYYNDPNDASLNRLSKENFKYYDVKHLHEEGGQWSYRGQPLKIYAAADLAFSEGSGVKLRKRDYTAICVLGVDCEGYIYILALDRFQTEKAEVYYDRIIELQQYWNFKKIVVETNNAGKIVKQQIESLVRQNGDWLEVEGKPHTSHSGKKEERIAQAVEPKYRTGTIFHFKGGYIKMLEEELILNRPAHDDLKDALAMCIEHSKPPGKRASMINKRTGTNNVLPISRFGGKRGKRNRI